MSEGKAPTLLTVRFNQTGQCLSVGTTQGYRIFTCEPFQKCFESNEGGASIVEMLFNTSLITLVGAGEQAALSPRRVRLCNTKLGRVICELSFVGTVLSVQLNRVRLVVGLESKLHVFDLKTMRMLHSLDTPPNPTGTFALSPSSQHCFLAFPSSAENKGDVVIYDAMNLRVSLAIRAHTTPVRCMAFNSDGTLLATASGKGTVVRLFAIPSGRKIASFRRGSYPAAVNGLCFNEDSSFLGVSSSDSTTVHIFKIETPNAAEEEGGTSASSSLASRFLPTALADMLEPTRHFAYASLKPGDRKSVV